MLKINIILVIGLIFLLYGILSHADASDRYWEAVGPRWCIALNPGQVERCKVDE